MVHRSSFLSTTCCWKVRGSLPHTSSGPYGELSSTVVPSRAIVSTSMDSRIPQAWMPMNPALVTRYGASIGLGPKRRCEVVRDPDLRES